MEGLVREKKGGKERMYMYIHCTSLQYNADSFIVLESICLKEGEQN